MASQVPQTSSRPGAVYHPNSGQGAAAQQREPMQDLIEYARQYATEQPEMAALWCLGIGFVLGWKLKPW